MSKAKATMSETLRAAIQDSGLSTREIGRRAGVHHDMLARFVAGKRTLTLPTADPVAEALGLELTKKKRRRKE